jgi:hypothetical protein
VSGHVPVADGALVLIPRDEDAALVERWLPAPHPHPDQGRAFVSLRSLKAGELSWLEESGGRAPTLGFGGVRAWVDAPTRRVVLAGRTSRGVLCLAEGTGVLDPAGAVDDGYTMLTMAAGLLLAAQGRVLVHAAAVRKPDGGVLLLAGDTHCGKSTTTLTLARSRGWAWLSDDQVVLTSSDDGSVEVLAWARRPHLDAGYLQGANTGERRDAEPGFVRSLAWAARGGLAGVLLPVVVGSEPSRSEPAPAAAALEALVRQGAWMLADPTAARMSLGVLSAAAAFGAWRLSLGLDCYATPDRLSKLVVTPD